MKLEKIVQALPIAVAMQASAAPSVVMLSAEGKATSTHTEVPRPKTAAVTDEKLTSTPQHEATLQENSFEVSFHKGATTWDEELSGRYEELVTREALGTIRRSELAELERLQILRRRLESPATGEELLQRHKREKLDRELLRVLRRHVRIEPFAKNSA